MIYLDNCATTKPDKNVIEVFERTALDYFANSNSLHNIGIESKKLEEYATNKISKIMRLKDKEIIYTSGATEANNTAIKGICNKYKNRGKHIITTMLEHSSIIKTVDYLSNQGFILDYVKIKDDGRVDIDNLKELMSDDTILVSISYVDSELGIRQEIDKIADIIREYPKCYFHVDCTQAIGKIDVNFNNIDLFSMSAHKIYGLKGIGMLVKNKNLVIEPLMHGGKSTTEYRSGTPALPLIVSLMKAIELVYENIEDNYKYVESLNKKITNELKKYDNVHINSTSNSIPYVINFSIKGIKSETFLHAMDEYNIYISTKSACAKSNTISDSVYAVTKNRDYAMNSLRVSLSYKNREEEIDRFIEVFRICLERLSLK